jgi:hypothetical protein
MPANHARIPQENHSPGLLLKEICCPKEVELVKKIGDHEYPIASLFH